LATACVQVEHTPAAHKRVLDILPGVSGGVARIMVGQPFDTIKTRLQVGSRHTAMQCNAQCAASAGNSYK
jgi:solute carrier family 25 carnitine/acylcarnitine transporter 20/29